MKMHSVQARIGVLFMLMMVVLSACGGSQTAGPAATVEPGSGQSGDTLAILEPSSVSGAIEITGSSTVFPLTSTIVQEFMEEGAAAEIDVKVTGTGAGFRVFCSAEGDVDIVNASRAITDEEQAACTAVGRPAVPFRVGTDALAVVVNAQNDFVTALSFEQLAQIFAGQVTTWAEIDTAYPVEPIAVFSPGTDSGTFDYFVEAVFDGDDQPLQNAAGIVMSEDDFELARGIAENPYAIGYFGYAYYQDNQDTLTAVAIDAGSGTAVAPATASVSDNSYPLARPLFIYSSPTIIQAQPQVAAFIQYYLQVVPEVIEEVGYFPATPEVLVESERRLQEALHVSATP